MKQLTLALVLLFSVLAIAQEEKKPEIFPFKRPQLLVGKTVTIRPLTDEEIEKEKGYAYFSSDRLGIHTYHEIDNDRSDPKSLENRTFKVVSTHPKYHNRLVLEAEDGEVIYYRLLEGYPKYYYFEVEGGLEVPNDFYCDYFDSGVEDENLINLTADGLEDYAVVWLVNGVTFETMEKDVVMLTMEIPSKENMGITVIFDNGTKLELPNRPLVASRKGNDRRGVNIEIVSDEYKKLFSENRIVSVLLGGKKESPENDISPEGGEKIRGVIACGLAKLEAREQSKK
ncbi:hypothetical protein Q763_17180 [Flavobacterium beibuense F44-8]|uniref:Uncharacterized protein n=1 Tax=Flavobacterium beibuense F44-8 TaxID=1406840 RepID=A0A0A2LHP0_9FLAO|nr:hypothetical protein [Flavobacterium beibuense]KGO78721.1 hypothetical protein Q763_17180 [Flavobacterium beibuense F44-8]